MSQITAEEFQLSFLRCVSKAVEEAQSEVSEELPEATRFELVIAGRRDYHATIDEIMDELFVDATFPRIVDVGVCGVERGAKIIWVRPSGHPFTAKLEETWNDPPGAGPFKSVGLMLPAYIWERPRPFRLSDLVESAREWLSKSASD